MTMSDFVITEVITKSRSCLRYLHKHLQQVVYFYYIMAKTCQGVFTSTDTAINQGVA